MPLTSDQAVDRRPALAPDGSLSWVAPRAPVTERMVAAVVALLASSVLAVAGTLAPDARGHGTHTQLGLSPCSTMARLGRPCPSCGMTTAFACFVRGDVIGAIKAQVLGTVLAACTLLAILGGAATALLGASFRLILRRIFVDRIEWLYVLIVLIGGSWAIKAYTLG